MGPRTELSVISHVKFTESIVYKSKKNKYQVIKEINKLKNTRLTLILLVMKRKTFDYLLISTLILDPLPHIRGHVLSNINHFHVLPNHLSLIVFLAYL